MFENCALTFLLISYFFYNELYKTASTNPYESVLDVDERADARDVYVLRRGGGRAGGRPELQHPPGVRARPSSDATQTWSGKEKTTAAVTGIRCHEQFE